MKRDMAELLHAFQAHLANDKTGLEYLDELKGMVEDLVEELAESESHLAETCDYLTSRDMQRMAQLF